MRVHADRSPASDRGMFVFDPNGQPGGRAHEKGPYGDAAPHGLFVLAGFAGGDQPTTSPDLVVTYILFIVEGFSPFSGLLSW